LIVGPSQSFEFVSQDADVCGVDEPGRGSLVGPVVAAAVVLDRRRPIDGLRNSNNLIGPCAIHRATFAPVREIGAEHAG